MIAPYCCPCDRSAHYAVFDPVDVQVYYVHSSRTGFYTDDTINLITPIVFQTIDGSPCPYRYVKWSMNIYGLNDEPFLCFPRVVTNNEPIQNRPVDGSVSMRYYYEQYMDYIANKIPTFNLYESNKFYCYAYEVSCGVYSPRILEPFYSQPNPQTSYYECEFIGSELLGVSGSKTELGVSYNEVFTDTKYDQCGLLAYDTVKVKHFHHIGVNFKCTFHYFAPAQKISCCDSINLNYKNSFGCYIVSVPPNQ